MIHHIEKLSRNKSKILFTTTAPPSKSPFFLTEKRPPQGLGSLISIVRNGGHEAFFIDNFLKPSNFLEEGILQKKDIDIIGISANHVCFEQTLHMIEKIEKLRRESLWNGKILVGGPVPCISPEMIPDSVDHVVQGEGENVILDIIEGRASKRIIKTDRIEELDDVPFQPWDIFSKLPYDYTSQWMDVQPVFTMNTSRGCPAACSFCSIGSIWRDEYTFFSADRIISEIEYLKKLHGVKGIYFREDNFTYDKDRLLDFCEKMIRKQIDVPWSCESRIDDFLDEKIVKLMKQAGCKAVFLGVESGSQSILDLLNKRITVDDITQAVDTCKRNDIKTYCSLLTGFPEETYEDYLLTQKLMNETKPFDYFYNVFVGIPYSPIYRKALKEKSYEHIDKNKLLYFPGFDVKLNYFYGLDSRNFIDHECKIKTEYDIKLLNDHKKYKTLKAIWRKASYFIPNRINKYIYKKKNELIFRN